MHLEEHVKDIADRSVQEQQLRLTVGADRVGKMIPSIGEASISAVIAGDSIMVVSCSEMCGEVAGRVESNSSIRSF